MSLRAWLAGQALAGQIAFEGAEGCGGDEGPRDVAAWCVDLADAVIAKLSKAEG